MYYFSTSAQFNNSISHTRVTDSLAKYKEIDNFLEILYLRSLHCFHFVDRPVRIDNCPGVIEEGVDRTPRTQRFG
jgi:hypothetical protein